MNLLNQENFMVDLEKSSNKDTLGFYDSENKEKF